MCIVVLVAIIVVVEGLFLILSLQDAKRFLLLFVFLLSLSLLLFPVLVMDLNLMVGSVVVLLLLTRLLGALTTLWDF